MNITKRESPSMDQWLKEAKQDPSANNIGMYLVHNGVVRETAKAKARGGDESAPDVTGMDFSYDEKKLEEVLEEGRNLKGIFYVRAWLNTGRLNVGDDIMYVLIGGDIRPNIVDALQHIVGRIKDECVIETELH